MSRNINPQTHCLRLAGIRYLAKGFPKGCFQRVSSQTFLVKKLSRRSFWSYTLDYTIHLTPEWAYSYFMVLVCADTNDFFFFLMLMGLVFKSFLE